MVQMEKSLETLEVRCDCSFAFSDFSYWLQWEQFFLFVAFESGVSSWISAKTAGSRLQTAL